MRPHTRIAALGVLLISCILIAACGGSASGSTSGTKASGPTVTPTPATPPGLLIFSSTGKRTFDQNGNAIAHYTTILNDLNPQTGAVLWASSPYSGQPVQQPVVLGRSALFAIGENVSNDPSGQSGTVTLYAVDLATGATKQVATLKQVYHSLASYNMELVRLNPTTAVLWYLSAPSISTATTTLMAFTSAPNTPLWQTKLPNNTYIQHVTVVNGDITARGYDATAKTPLLIIIKGSDGSIVRDCSGRP